MCDLEPQDKQPRVDDPEMDENEAELNPDDGSDSGNSEREDDGSDDDSSTDDNGLPNLADPEDQPPLARLADVPEGFGTPSIVADDNEADDTNPANNREITADDIKIEALKIGLAAAILPPTLYALNRIYDAFRRAVGRNPERENFARQAELDRIEQENTTSPSDYFMVGREKVEPGRELYISQNRDNSALIPQQPELATAVITRDPDGNHLAVTKEGGSAYIKDRRGNIRTVTKEDGPVKINNADSISLGGTKFFEVKTGLASRFALSLDGANHDLLPEHFNDLPNMEVGTEFEVCYDRSEGMFLRDTSEGPLSPEERRTVVRSGCKIGQDEKGVYVVDSNQSTADSGSTENIGIQVNNKALSEKSQGERRYVKPADEISIGFDLNKGKSGKSPEVLQFDFSLTKLKNVALPETKAAPQKANIVAIATTREGNNRPVENEIPKVAILGNKGEIVINGNEVPKSGMAALMHYENGQLWIKSAVNSKLAIERGNPNLSPERRFENPADGSWVPLNPGDRVQVVDQPGTIPFEVQRPQIRPNVSVRINGQMLDLQPGETIEIGGGPGEDSVQGHEGRQRYEINNENVDQVHAEIGVDKDGNTWVRDIGPNGEGSTTGTYVNDRKIVPGDKVYLNEHRKLSFGDKSDGAVSVKAYGATFDSPIARVESKPLFPEGRGDPAERRRPKQDAAPADRLANKVKILSGDFAKTPVEAFSGQSFTIGENGQIYSGLNSKPKGVELGATIQANVEGQFTVTAAPGYEVRIIGSDGSKEVISNNDGKTAIKPGDKLELAYEGETKETLAGFKLSEEVRPALDVTIAGEKLDLRVGEELEIGRRDDFPKGTGENGRARIEIEQSQISRKHAVINVDNNGNMTITDLKSRNGVYVDGHRLEANKPCPITINSKISFGDPTSDDTIPLKLSPYGSAEGNSNPDRAVVRAAEARAAEARAAEARPAEPAQQLFEKPSKQPGMLEKVLEKLAVPSEIEIKTAKRLCTDPHSPDREIAIIPDRGSHLHAMRIELSDQQFRDLGKENSQFEKVDTGKVVEDQPVVYYRDKNHPDVFFSLVEYKNDWKLVPEYEVCRLPKAAPTSEQVLAANTQAKSKELAKTFEEKFGIELPAEIYEKLGTSLGHSVKTDGGFNAGIATAINSLAENPANQEHVDDLNKLQKLYGNPNNTSPDTAKLRDALSQGLSDIYTAGRPVAMLDLKTHVDIIIEHAEQLQQEHDRINQLQEKISELKAQHQAILDQAEQKRLDGKAAIDIPSRDNASIEENKLRRQAGMFYKREKISELEAQHQAELKAYQKAIHPHEQYITYIREHPELCQGSIQRLQEAGIEFVVHPDFAEDVTDGNKGTGENKDIAENQRPREGGNDFPSEDIRRDPDPDIASFKEKETSEDKAAREERKQVDRCNDINELFEIAEKTNNPSIKLRAIQRMGVLDPRHYLDDLRTLVITSDNLLDVAAEELLIGDCSKYNETDIALVESRVKNGDVERLWKEGKIDGLQVISAIEVTNPELAKEELTKFLDGCNPETREALLRRILSYDKENGPAVSLSENLKIEAAKRLIADNPEDLKTVLENLQEHPNTNLANFAEGKLGELFVETSSASPSNPAVSLKDIGNKGRDRLLYIDGEAYHLKHHKGWYYGLKDGAQSWNTKDMGSVKLHVSTAGAQDLAKLQEALIPVLMNDPDVSAWKTMDPKIGFGLEEDLGLGTGQDAKGFTIYCQDGQAAARIQERLSSVIQQNNLALDQSFVSGNLEVVDGTNRIGISRSNFAEAKTADGKRALMLDPLIARSIESEFGKKFGLQPGQKFSSEQLREIERCTGLRPETLSYGKPTVAIRARDQIIPGGRLVLRSDYLNDREHAQSNYATEKTAGKGFGDLTDRPAMFALAERYGVDITRLDGETLSIPDNLKPGESITLGRRDVAVHRSSVRSEHIEFGRHSNGEMYIKNLAGENSTSVRQAGEEDFRVLAPNEEVVIDKNTEIKLGAGTDVHLAPITNPEGYDGEVADTRPVTKQLEALCANKSIEELTNLAKSNNKYISEFALQKISEAKPDNFNQILMDIAKSDSHAVDDAIEKLSFRQDPALLDLVKERWAGGKGDLLNLMKEGKVDNVKLLASVSKQDPKLACEMLSVLSENIPARHAETLHARILGLGNYEAGMDYSAELPPAVKEIAVENLAKSRSRDALIEVSENHPDAEIRELAERNIPFISQSDPILHDRQTLTHLEECFKEVSRRPELRDPKLPEIYDAYKESAGIKRIADFQFGEALAAANIDPSPELADLSPAEFRERFPDQPKLHKAHELLHHAIEKEQQTKEALSTRLEPRIAALNEMLEGFHTDTRQPTNKVSAIYGDVYNRQLDPRTGDVRISAALLSGEVLGMDVTNDGSMKDNGLFGLIGHELTHFDQHTLVMRAHAAEIAGDLDARVAHVCNQFEEKFGVRPNKDYVERVLTAVGNTPLSADEKERAQKLEGSFIELKEVGKLYKEIGQLEKQMSDLETAKSRPGAHIEEINRKLALLDNEYTAKKQEHKTRYPELFHEAEADKTKRNVRAMTNPGRTASNGMQALLNAIRAGADEAIPDTNQEHPAASHEAPAENLAAEAAAAVDYTELSGGVKVAGNKDALARLKEYSDRFGSHENYLNYLKAGATQETRDLREALASVLTKYQAMNEQEQLAWRQKLFQAQLDKEIKAGNVEIVTESQIAAGSRPASAKNSSSEPASSSPADAPPTSSPPVDAPAAAAVNNADLSIKLKSGEIVDPALVKRVYEQLTPGETPNSADILIAITQVTNESPENEVTLKSLLSQFVENPDGEIGQKLRQSFTALEQQEPANSPRERVIVEASRTDVLPEVAVVEIPEVSIEGIKVTNPHFSAKDITPKMTEEYTAQAQSELKAVDEALKDSSISDEQRQKLLKSKENLEKIVSDSAYRERAICHIEQRGGLERTGEAVKAHDGKLPTKSRIPGTISKLTLGLIVAYMFIPSQSAQASDVKMPKFRRKSN